MLTYPGNIFTWRGNEGTAEMSDLGPSFRGDGFVVKSHRTGHEVTFFRDRTADEKDGEGELLAITFRPSTGPLSIKLFND